MPWTVIIKTGNIVMCSFLGENLRLQLRNFWEFNIFHAQAVTLHTKES